MGIPADKQQDIFQEFFQLANPEHDRGKGLGLGLAIVERSARLLDHRIALRSTPGKGIGVRHRITLGGRTSRRRVDGAGGTPTGRSLNDKFVVVVDDEALVREGMQGLLASWGCRVLSVASGDEALAALAGEDVRRMRSSATTACARRRKRYRRHPAIAVPRAPPMSQPCSSAATPRPNGCARPRRAAIACCKPVQPAKLRAVLSHLCSLASKPQASGVGLGVACGLRRETRRFFTPSSLSPSRPAGDHRLGTVATFSVLRIAVM